MLDCAVRILPPLPWVWVRVVGTFLKEDEGKFSFGGLVPPMSDLHKHELYEIGSIETAWTEMTNCCHQQLSSVTSKFAKVHVCFAGKNVTNITKRRSSL